jgi:2-polyprenyl-6-hydroxyphenyl methylase/3-demethylubiquinone-9 3-methyltransferase
LSKDYYSQKLSAERLRKVYELAPPRVMLYLEAEIDYVRHRVLPGSLVLELGCGYGRVLQRLSSRTGRLVGIDTSEASLLMAGNYLKGKPMTAVMNAVRLGFKDKCLDLVACIQNGISAFRVDQEELVREALRVTRPGGRVLFSSYSDKFWPDRLNWFRIQADHGLLGEIDEKATGNGVIVCKDGFRATTVGPADFRALASRIGAICMIEEVDDSSIFCEMLVPE